MEKILNKLLDLPQVVNSKLPGNTFKFWVQDSEGNIPAWVGKFYTVFSPCSIVNITSCDSFTCLVCEWERKWIF